MLVTIIRSLKMSGFMSKVCERKFVSNLMNEIN